MIKLRTHHSTDKTKLKKTCQQKNTLSKFSIILKFSREFCSTSTIHGFNHIVKTGRHPLEKVIWLTLVTGAVFGVGVFSNMTLSRYNGNPTVISMERDRFSWNTSFPAATICPLYKLNEPLLEKYVAESSVEDKTIFKQFLRGLAQADFNNFEQLVDYNDLRSDDYLKVLLQLKFEFKPTVSNSGSNPNEYVLEEIISEMGICYSYNSKLAVYNTLNYWEKGQWNLIEGKETFYLNPLDGEIFANIINVSTGYKIYIHGPYEVADISSKYILSENEYFLQMYLIALTLFTSDRTRSLGVNQRKCRFYDESNLKHSPAYSYVLCKTECRIALCKKLCGCIPHFYRKLDGEVVCDVPGLHCLSKYKERLILLRKECSCLPNCDEVNYIVEELDSREWFLGSNLQWGMREYPKMRLRRDVIFGFTDLLVSIGGMAGLFLGCSVLSFIEIIYFFSIRLFWFVLKYGKDTKHIRNK